MKSKISDSAKKKKELLKNLEDFQKNYYAPMYFVKSKWRWIGSAITIVSICSVGYFLLSTILINIGADEIVLVLFYVFGCLVFDVLTKNKTFRFKSELVGFAFYFFYIFLISMLLFFLLNCRIIIYGSKYWVVAVIVVFWRLTFNLAFISEGIVSSWSYIIGKSKT